MGDRKRKVRIAEVGGGEGCGEEGLFGGRDRVSFTLKRLVSWKIKAPGRGVIME